MARFKKYVREQQIEHPDMDLLTRLFKRNQIIALWNKLRRERKSADISVKEAWGTLAGAGQTNVAKQNTLIDFLVLPPGAWHNKLVEMPEN